MAAVMKLNEPSARFLDVLQPAVVRQFELFATAPGSVGRLRELILRLAVQGKLTAQDPNDKPARALLERASAPQAPLATSGRARPRKVRITQAEDITPPLPLGWEWVRLADIVRILNGRAYSKQELLERGPTPVLRVGNLFTSKHWYFSDLQLDPDKYCEAGDLLYAWSASFGPIIWNGPKAIYHYHIWKLDPIDPQRFNRSYLYNFLLEKTVEIKAAGHGVSMLHMTKEKMERLLVPYPPLPEQARIVARVDELMRLCDALEAKDRLEAEQHARLLSTLLGTLTDSRSPEELAANWLRVVTNFELLLDRPEAVDALEQKIVQLATRGLLVPQDPGDEPASEIPTLVVRERSHLSICGTPVRNGASAPVLADEQPFDLPSGWTWVRTGDLLLSSEAGWSPTCHATPRPHGRWGVLKVSAVSWGSFDPEANKELPAALEPRIEYEVRSGDFLLSRANTEELVARSVVVDDQCPPKLMLSDKIIRLHVSSHVNRAFLCMSNNSDHTRAYYKAHASGTSSSMKNVSREVVLAAPVALPPMQEQSRIVARVTHLRRLCADLRQRLTASRATQARLADALIELVTAA